MNEDFKLKSIHKTGLIESVVDKIKASNKKWFYINLWYFCYKRKKYVLSK